MKKNSSSFALLSLLIMLIVAGGFFFALVGCTSDASVASKNASRAADNFEIVRRIVFYNGITGEYILVVEGRCSINDDLNQLELICKTGPKNFKKHFLGLSDNVTYFAEQLEDSELNAYRYRVFFKPEAIVPDIDFKSSIFPQKE